MSIEQWLDLYYGNEIIQTFIIELHALYKIIIQHSDYNVNKLHNGIHLINNNITFYWHIAIYYTILRLFNCEYRLLYKDVNKQKYIYTVFVNVKV